MSTLTVTVNGTARTLDVEDRTMLADLLREQLQLTGTHVGCDTSQCGACTVLINGVPAKSCTILAAAVDGAGIVTIEGLADGDRLHPVQKAFREHHALQCGFCTPGMIMMGVDIIARHGSGLTEQTVREELEGNLCRCTGYQNIVSAILAAARQGATS
ncbi:MAG: (2Fe-2S)-binding protein [Nannocystaceae bacterium]